MPTPPDDVMLNKASIMERCCRRIVDEYEADTTLCDHTHLDAMMLNMERACQASIDLAMHIVAVNHLGMPQSSSDAFTLLCRSGMITEPLCRSLRGMAGFRNVAIHEYQELDLSIVRDIATQRHQDFAKFCTALGMRIVLPCCSST